MDRDLDFKVIQFLIRKFQNMNTCPYNNNINPLIYLPGECQKYMRTCPLHKNRNKVENWNNELVCCFVQLYRELTQEEEAEKKNAKI